jgi:hypothetical protein
LVLTFQQAREAQMMFTLESALDDDSITIIERNDSWGLYRFQVGMLKTIVSVKLCRSPVSDETRYELSHAIHTPTQIGPYHQSRLFWDYPAYALHEAITSITMHYNIATKNGYASEEGWLVANEFREI